MRGTSLASSNSCRPCSSYRSKVGRVLGPCLGLKRELISSLRLISTAAPRISIMSRTFPLEAFVVGAGAVGTPAVSAMTAIVFDGWYTIVEGRYSNDSRV